MTTFSYKYFCEEATRFISIMGQKKSWKCQCGDRVIDNARQGLTYCFLHMTGTEKEVRSAQDRMNAIMIDFGLRNAIVHAKI